MCKQRLATYIGLSNIIKLKFIKFPNNSLQLSTFRYGTTPLHLCLCQEHVSRSCVQVLVESGAKLQAKNSSSVAPFQLVSDDLSPFVLLLQKSIIDQAFKQMTTLSARADRHRTQEFDTSSLTSSLDTSFRLKALKNKLSAKHSHNRFSKASAKDVHICLDNVSVHSVTADPNSDSFNESISSDLWPHKRSLITSDSVGAHDFHKFRDDSMVSRYDYAFTRHRKYGVIARGRR